MNWIVPANSKIYNHKKAFAKFGEIDWKQKNHYQVGDIVYIYCTRPMQCIKYKCLITKTKMSFEEHINDKEFWYDTNEYENSKSELFARFKLIETLDNDNLTYQNLLEHGLSGIIQGARTISDELTDYIESYFENCFSNTCYHDVDEKTQFHEGHVFSVLVNKYERSPKARMQCIEHHGAYCHICEMEFEKIYGEIGKGFIHVHHLVPLHTIGKDYVINPKTDLIPVCPNCHSMIHKIIGGDTMTVEELKRTLLSKH